MRCKNFIREEENMREVDTAMLRYYMEKSGLKTIESLSNTSGINRNTLSGVLSGKIFPSSDVMSRLITALDIPVEEAGSIFFKVKLA